MAITSNHFVFYCQQEKLGKKIFCYYFYWWSPGVGCMVLFTTAVKHFIDPNGFIIDVQGGSKVLQKLT